MYESIAVAIITGGLALAGNVISNLSTHSKTMYRIEQLEKVTEVLDERQRTANHRIDDLERMESHE